MIRIEHIALWSEDIEQLKDFYVKYFGATANQKYLNEKKQFSSYFLSFVTGARIEIMHSPDILRSTHCGKTSGYAHLAISLGSEYAVDTLTKQLKADGIEVVDGPRRTGDGYYESVVLDPQGNKIELTV